jgi:hypothetical protein
VPARACGWCAVAHLRCVAGWLCLGLGGGGVPRLVCGAPAIGPLTLGSLGARRSSA